MLNLSRDSGGDEHGRDEVTGREHDVCLLFFFGSTSPADVSCHVVAALPVPLGQRVCNSAVPGHFLRHHPAAPWSEAWADHRPHDR